jgi:DNA polymerase-3 subunit delta
LFYIIYGQDSYLIHEELMKIKNSLGDPDMLETNTNVLDGRQVTLRQLQDICNAMPFLHQVRLVIVEGLLDRFEVEGKAVKRGSKPKAKASSELKEWQELCSYIGKMPATTVLVFVDGKIDARKNVLFKQINSSAEIREPPSLRGESLGNWIRKRITEGGGSASHGTINLLEKLVGNDLWNMGNEIDKLVTFSNGRLITEDDVRQVTSYTREANIFALVDAILDRNGKEAQQMLHRLLQDGAAPSYILSMITRQLRLITMVKECGSDMSHQQIMDRLNIRQDWQFKILARQSKSYTMNRISRAYHKILETDLAMKTGKCNEDVATDLLVIDLCKSHS